MRQHIAVVIMCIMCCTSMNAQPNIVLILIDDGRYDDYATTGAPSFFNVPAINRIATEGVTFRYAYSVTPLCSPSRAVIQSGLYGHRTGNLYNYDNASGSVMDTSLFILAPELKKAGYVTGFIGKAFNDWKKPLAGYDFWAGSTAGNSYYDQSFNIDGINQTMPGYFSDVVNDMAASFVGEHISERFFLMVSHKAPHSPLGAKEGGQIYEGEEIEVPANFYKYTNNYPSFLYPGFEFTKGETKLQNKIQKYYETLVYVDSGLQRIIDTLEAYGRMDSTMIIYTSDHGFILGEHMLNGKGMAYEESLRIPLFIRYPVWFVPSVESGSLATNLDILPTIFEAAGVSYTGLLDGVSLKNLSRKEFMYEFSIDAIPGIPSFRGIRTMNYKYTNYFCDDVIRELFDLQTDSAENTNVAYDPAYTITAISLQQKLDSMRISLGDISDATVSPCILLGSQEKKINFPAH